MATATKKQILLLMDSRGANLQKELEQQLPKSKPNMQIKVMYKRGGNIQTITEIGTKILSEGDYDECLLFAGVNNITRKARYGCELIFTNIKSMCEELTSEFMNAYTTLKKNCNKVIVCHLIGLDIARYNKASPQAYMQDQEIINEAVCQINKSINKMNIDHEVKGPWLDDTIHAATCKKVIHKYKRLYDGLHPDENTVKIWAKKIISSL